MLSFEKKMNEKDKDKGKVLGGSKDRGGN